MITPQFRRLSLVLGLISAIGLLCACASSEKLLGSSASPEPTVNIPPRIIGYFTSWGVAARGYPVASIPADKLTHINYAFSAISPLGKCALGDPTADTQRFYSIRDSVDKQADIKDGPHGTFNQLLKLKQKYPHIKVLISLGGWTGSSLFSDVAQTEESRQKFVQSCIELYLQKHAGVFDGVDVDWEYPVSGGARDGKPEDKHNYTLLLEEFRKQLDAQGQADGVQYLLTIAAPAGPQIIANFELDQIDQYLDWINLMTYDFHGGWDTTTNFLSALYKSSDDPSSPAVRDAFNVDAVVQAYRKAGIPAHKLVVGIPFYARGWQGVPEENNGLYQSASGPAQSNLEPGVFTYSQLVKGYLPTYSRFMHPEAGVPWLYNPETGVMITYEDPESVGLKAEYVKENSLGGVMLWELSQDGGELLNALYNILYP